MALLFLWPFIPGGHPAGRRYATLKIALGNFFYLLSIISPADQRLPRRLA
jgi:hypothetical protein